MATQQRTMDDFFGSRPGKKRKVAEEKEGGDPKERGDDAAPTRAEVNRAVALTLVKTRKIRER